MKYIMYHKDSMKFPIIFPDIWVHSDVDQAIKQLGMFKDLVAVSAGELNLVMSDFDTYGKSDTLGLKSNPDDARIIKMYNYEFGAIY